MLLQAYFDESERRGGIFAVAGFAFKPKQAKAFSRAWKRILRGRSCWHTTDLLATQGEFKGLKREVVDRMMREAATIINDRTEAASMVVCERAEFESVAPKYKGGPRDPYPLCCHLCMAQLGRWLERTRGYGEIAYIFESGYQHAGEAHRLLSLAQTPEGRAMGLVDLYRYRSHTFMDRRDAPPLQAADLLAWEWTKVYAETVKQPIRPPRGSLLALMRRRPDSFLELHLTGLPLRRFLEQLPFLDEL